MPVDGRAALASAFACLIGAASAEIDDHVRSGSSSGRRHAALVALSF
jgi:hypothetical protein